MQHEPAAHGDSARLNERATAAIGRGADATTERRSSLHVENETAGECHPGSDAERTTVAAGV